MTVVVGSTMAAWKANGSETDWLTHAEEMARSADVQFFAALEVDARGLDPFAKLLGRLDALGGEHWQFTYDDGAERITASNRIARICAGRNMVTEYAIRREADWVLFLDSDVTPDPDCLPKLLDLDWPIVGGDVPSYCLGGPVVDDYAYPVQRHWNTAGFLLVHRTLFRKLRWRVDPDEGMTDDPCYAADALELGFATLVRKDVIGRHALCTPLEDSDADRAIRR